MTIGVRTDRLVARTRAVGREPDVGRRLAGASFVFWRDGRGLVCQGVARRVPLGHVAEVLGAVDVDAEGPEEAAGRPVAVGALPFDPLDMAGARMIIPARVWRVDEEGHAWVTEVAPVGGRHDAGGKDLDGERTSFDTAHRPMTHAGWTEAVGAALADIESGALEKVVLSRDLEVRADHPIPATEIAARLVDQQPGSFVFLADDVVGASPELLVERRGALVRSRPMAGTVAGTEAAAVSWLDRSDKDRREHRLVVDAVVDALGPFASGPPSVSGPMTTRLVGLSHFVTDIEARLSDTTASALDLAVALHPTPAVAGVPTESALALIRRLEGRSRGLYAGPVGWVDASGDGQFAVALRCARISGHRAVLHAGAGIVAGSDPDREWKETAAKFGPMYAALGPDTADGDGPALTP
jgi:menaquinone-specific isochorismate synthase